MLLIVGPRSSGKSRMLHEVLLGKQHKALVAFVNGRSQRLTDAAIMASALSKEGARQLPEARQKLEELKGLVGKATAAAAAGSEIFSKFKPGVDLKSLELFYNTVLKLFSPSTEARSLNDVIQAYDELLRLSSTIISTASPLPVICIDEANVLMEWRQGGAAMEKDLDALLRFFVKVTAPPW